MKKNVTIDPGSGIDLSNVPIEFRAAFQRALNFSQRERTIRSAEDLENLEDEARKVADDLFQSLMAPKLQQAVDSPEVQEAAQQLVGSVPQRLRSDGRKRVNVRTSRGTVVPVFTTYYRQRSHDRRRAGKKRNPGLYPELVVLGIHDHCTPKLASDVSRSVAMLSSLKEAEAHLSGEGIDLDVKTIRSIAYRYAQRARAVQQAADYGLSESMTGRHVVVSIDGGRLRTRKKKRGPKTPKGRSRYHTDWHEPKLIILYVVDPDGRPSRTWAPIIDGTLRGPEAAFGLLRAYAQQISLTEADKVLFVADGARWIWTRFVSLVASLGLRANQVLMLIDFYHAAQKLSEAVKLRRWPDVKRKQWLTTNRRLLRQGKLEPVIAALKGLCKGRNAGKIRTLLRYFTRNRDRFAYDRIARLKLPMGSGAMESAVRRVVNLRIKGASIYWLEESVEAILLLRAYYKSNRWSCLQRLATCPEYALL